MANSIRIKTLVTDFDNDADLPFKTTLVGTNLTLGIPYVKTIAYINADGFVEAFYADSAVVANEDELEFISAP